MRHKKLFDVALPKGLDVMLQDESVDGWVNADAYRDLMDACIVCERVIRRYRTGYWSIACQPNGDTAIVVIHNGVVRIPQCVALMILYVGPRKVVDFLRVNGAAVVARIASILDIIDEEGVSNE